MHKCILATLALIFSVSSHSATPQKKAAEILKTSGVTGGLVVHLGAGDGAVTEALRGNRESIIVHGLEPDKQAVDAARAAILKTGNYGNVSIEHFSGTALPYLEGIVNLVVVDNPGEITDKEVMRVLRPGGVALKRDGKNGWAKTLKPWRDSIDDWTHFFHNAGGNAVAKDSEVGPPRHMKWVGSPKWSRHHDRMASMSALVSNDGRLFYIMDEGSRISIQLPSKWELVGRDAFNGVILWRRDIPEWHTHLWPLKSGPTQLARRLVATGDHVYATLGITSPVSMMDAATGETTRVFEGSEGTEELIVEGKTLYLISMEGEHELADYLPASGASGDQGTVAKRWKWNELPRKIMAFDTTTGKQLWKHISRVSPLTISASEGNFFYHDGDKVVALNGKDGSEMWTGEKADRRDQVTFNFGPKLVVVGGKVLFAGGDRQMHTYDAKTGEEIWSAPHARGGYQSPEDLLVLKNTVWSAPLTSGKDSGTYTGRNLLTGEIEKEFSPNVDTYWFHHRCYIAKATENFLMPSRTGIEFVDPEKENWDINHWVRGGCLYGVMPANGLTYAPPHNCACYPETKLYGFNALSATGPRPDNPSKDRLEKGPAFGKVVAAVPAESDWPTFRADEQRSGFTSQSIAGKNLTTEWETDLGGRLSAIVSANGKLFVSQIDQHTVHALDTNSGKPLWAFTTGGRVDSPPTIHKGAVIFGCADGNVYCLRAEDGELAWKFKAAPSIERHMAFEQLESVWPVHGSVLVKNDHAYFVAGRSNFLDGGLRFYGLDVDTGKVVSEKIINEINPETGNNIQEKIQTLQMPAGLPDILSASGGYIYMRSQKMDLSGERLEIGPHSGDAATQGAVQREGEHLFAPMSFLDDTWFHRSYWVFGKSFAGGHNGYYQAGKNTPSGRILVFNDKDVFGFGRKPEYLKWTTTLEHQLFSASRNAPEGALTVVDDADLRRGKAEPPKGESKGKGKAKAKQGAQSGSYVEFGSTKTLSPIGHPLGIEAWVKPDTKEGVIAAHGGPHAGYAITMRKGIPCFIYRNDPEKLLGAVAKNPIPQGVWTHLVGQITADKKLQLFVNGKLAATGKADGFITQEPAQGLQVASDMGSAVGTYKSPLPFSGLIDEFSVFHGTLSAEEVTDRFKNPGATAQPENASIVLFTDFDKGDATDFSGNSNSGSLVGVKKSAKGKNGGALEFTGKSAAYGGGKQGGSLVKPYWTQDIPLLARAMVLADKTLFVAGPPDLFNEVETFKQLAADDETVQKILAEQDAAMAGAQGGLLRAFDAKTGETLSEIKLPSLPIWDGMAAANGKLLLSTKDGRVIAISGK